MNKIKQFISGIVIGIGVVLPGVSGSVLAILLGIYDDVIYLLNDNSKSIITKILNLYMIIFGLFIGITLFGNILLIFYEKMPFYVMYIFIGLILGGIPVLIKEINEKCNDKIDYKYLIFTLIFSLLIMVLPKLLNIQIINNINKFNPLYLLLAGFLYISGKIIPGVSSSIFLMMLGLYEYILTIMSNPFTLSINELILLIPFFIGILIGVIILVKLINFLLKKYFKQTYSAIIGFVLGSIFSIYPGFEFSFRGIFSLFLMCISFILMYKLSKKK